MASETWSDFPQVLRRLQTTHVARLRTDNKNDEATALHTALQTMIDESTSVGAAGGPVTAARQDYMRRRNALDQRRQDVLTAFERQNGTLHDAMTAAWQPYYDRYVAELHRLDGLYDFSAGRRNVAAIGDVIADRGHNRLIRVTEVNTRQGSNYGIRAVAANVSGSDGATFYNYTDYAATGDHGWGPVGARPPLLPFARISAGGGVWRSTERHVVIDDVSRGVGTPSRREPVPGITLPGVVPVRDQRGHLVAQTLGGPGDFASGNIVAMTTASNQGGMARKLENPVRRLFESDPLRSDPVNR